MLAGLEEPKRFKLLTQILNNDLNIKDLPNRCEDIKAKKLMKQKFVEEVKVKDWDEALQKFV